MSSRIIGIGTDLVAIARIRKIWDQYRDSFARRILTKKELEDFQNQALPVSFLAKRYAAKEAVAKALGTGFQPNGFWLTDIGVHNNGLGKPYLEFSDRMKKGLEEQRIVRTHISLSDEKDYALAFVIIEGLDSTS